MQLFHFTCLPDQTVEELNSELSINLSNLQGDDGGEGTSFESNYRNLPVYLRCCFDYCCLFHKRYSIDRAKLVRLLLAEELVQAKPCEIVDDIAKKIIEQLVSLGMLQELKDGTELIVSSPYLELSTPELEIQETVTLPANSPIRVVIDDPLDIPPNSQSLVMKSFFSYSYHNGFSAAFMKAICEMKFLVVLDLYGKIEHLPNEIGELTHLEYLALKSSELDELPGSIGNLQKLQTLDISWCRKLDKLPVEVLSIQHLRHLIMSNSVNNCEVKVPKGIGTLMNLHTLSGLYAGGGIADELSRLTQVQELGVKRVSDDHAVELFASIKMMVNIVSLSLEAEGTFIESKRISLFPSLESFSAPPLLQELYLHGNLVEVPTWIASMENLSRLELFDSNLYENPALVLQYLSNLKHLTLWRAYKAKRIGKEFCEAGGFAKLEYLTICSDFLVEWAEIQNGAFPSLKYLSLHSCLDLMFLPEGLQYISTLEQLWLLPLCHDLARRLKGIENYKIKHIPVIYVLESE